VTASSRSHTDTPRKLESWCGFGPYCTDDTPCDVHALLADLQRTEKAADVLLRKNMELRADLQRLEAENKHLRDRLAQFKSYPTAEYRDA